MKGMIMSKAIAQLNNVDIGAVGNLVSAIHAEPETANTTWKASVEWTGWFKTTTTIREFDPFPTDEPEGLGGTDTAPNPVEQLIGALGSCLAIGYAANATIAGVRLDDLRIEIEGDLNLTTFLGIAPGNAGYETLRATVHIESDADERILKDLHDKVLATSPVGHTLSNGVPLRIELAWTSTGHATGGHLPPTVRRCTCGRRQLRSSHLSTSFRFRSTFSRASGRSSISRPFTTSTRGPACTTAS